jgi:hypothetical protein
MKKNLATLPFTLEGLVRAARIPAYATRALLAVVLVAFGLLAPIDNLREVLTAFTAGPLSCWGALHAISTTQGERALTSSKLHGAAVRIDSLGPHRSKR